MPSVLIETGFITNAAEEKFLNSQQGQDYLASAIFRACRDYINEIDSKTGTSFGKPEPVINPDNSQTLITRDGELVFLVQISTSSAKTEIKPDNFNGLKDVVEINAEDRYKYASGRFSDYSDAVIYRQKIEAVYPDAFVIAVKNNKILPLQEALEQTKNK
jgi:N-acetylmuramoyl-L-alanine amidase